MAIREHAEFDPFQMTKREKKGRGERDCEEGIEKQFVYRSSLVS